MKIIIGSESFSPNISGVAIVTEFLAENLTKIGHEVFVFVPSREYQTHYDDTVKNYRVLRLKSTVNPFRKGFRIAFLPKKLVFKEVEKIHPDIIHLQDPTSICTALRKAGKKFNIPVVITHHFSLDYVLSYLKYLKPLHPTIRKILSNYLVKFYNCCNYVICPTEFVKKELLKWGVKSPVEAISSGVDLARFFSYSPPEIIRLKYHLPSNKIVLYVGRLDKDKSIEILIESIPQVVQETNAHFVLAGSGDELPKLQDMAAKLGVENFCSFLGRISHEPDDLPKIYQIASVFVIPSTIETQSIVTLEALASGLPVVAAKAGALPELVKDDKNGFLFEPGDSKQLSSLIIKILKDERLRKSMSKESLTIVANHQIKESLDKVRKVYEKVLSTFQK